MYGIGIVVTVSTLFKGDELFIKYHIIISLYLLVIFNQAFCMIIVVVALLGAAFILGISLCRKSWNLAVLTIE